jgi:transcription antitermination factor NusA-like protein
MFHSGESCGGRNDSVLRILVERMRQIGTPRGRWEFNIKMDVNELGYVSVVQYTDQGRTFVNTVLHFQLVQMAWYIWIS